MLDHLTAGWLAEVLAIAGGLVAVGFAVGWWARGMC